MNTGSTLGTALLRGAYAAIGTGAAAFLTCYATTDDLKASAITAGIVALGALGFRGGLEGQFDAKRAAAVDMKPSDVGWIPPNPVP